MKAGRVGWYLTGGKERPVIILHVREEHAVVLFGTSTAGRDLPHECIDQKTVTGRNLPLSNPTYFYVTNVVPARLSEIRVTGMCAPRVFFSIERKLVEWMKNRDAASRQPPHSLIALTAAGELEYPSSEQLKVDRSKP